MINGTFINTHGLSIDDTSYQSSKLNECNLYIVGRIYNLNSIENQAEYLIHEYMTHGVSCFCKMDGAFVIMIFDKEKTIIVRDRHGVGEQIYYTDTYFDSSLYRLIQNNKANNSPNVQALSLFLTSGHIASPSCSIVGVNKLEAGHVLIYKSRKTSVQNLFPVPDLSPVTSSKSLEEYADIFYNLHKDAIQRRIKDSKQVGILLSGGYDSGANLIALREMYSGYIYSYSIGFKNDSISELPQARLMADTFQSIHKEYEIDGSEIKSLPDIIRFLGDPFAECGMMVNYCVMNLTGNHYPGVLLGGEGNDHYFSSANRQMAIHYLASKVGMKPAMKFIKSLLDRDMFDKDSLSFRTNFHLETSLNIIQGEIFGFPKHQIPKYLQNPSLFKAPELIIPNTDSYEKLYMQHVHYTDIIKSLNRIILFKSSKMAQMTGNHISFPFVDLEIYKFMNELPVKYKCKADNLLSIALGKCTSKYLHKYIYSSKMPETIAQKSKQGGFVPMAIFFKDDIQRKRMADIILSSSVCDDFLNRNSIERFIKNFENEINKPAKWFWYRQIKCNQFFNLLSLAIWWEEFVERREVYF